jgi:hypothetical protein
MTEKLMMSKCKKDIAECNTLEDVKDQVRVGSPEQKRKEKEMLMKKKMMLQESQKGSFEG